MLTTVDQGSTARSQSTHGQPIDYFELEQHRLHNLANAMTLAITEGFGDYVDTREWQQDDPSFGFGRVGAPLLYTSLNDRDDGKFPPIFQTQMDLAAIRAEARNVTALSGGVMGAIGTLSNYTLGGGLKFTAQRAACCPNNASRESVDALVFEAQQVIDRFLRENRFQSDMDREIDARSREDGEAFVELCVSPAGQIRASFDEPDMVCQPSSPGPIEDWLRDQDHQRYSPEWAWSWSYGIHCIRRTPDDPLGYHVVYDTTGDDWEYIPANRMLHVKRNVPRNVKRGVSDLYWIANDVQREAKIRRNTADGAALQAAIAWFREHAQGTTAAAVQGLVSGQAVDTRQQRTSSGTRPTKQGKLRSGTVVDIPESMRVLPGPMGSERNANFILIAQYVARSIAQRWAMPEFMFTSDASNANYASTLVAESPFVKARETDQRFYGQAFVELLWKVLRLAHEIGRAFRGVQHFHELQQILEITATGPRVSNRDELQTVQRQQIEIEMGTLSLETAAAEMGRDLAKEQAKGAKPKDEEQGGTGTTGLQESCQESPVHIASSFTRSILECGGKGGKPGPCPKAIKKSRKGRPANNNAKLGNLKDSAKAAKQVKPQTPDPNHKRTDAQPPRDTPQRPIRSQIHRDGDGNVLNGVKPKHSPTPKKWIDKGGDVTVDADGTWTYHDWEGNSVSYPGGYPDFKNANKVEFTVDLVFEGNHSSDFKNADKLLPKPPLPKGLTWHHHQDLKTMQAIPTKIHDRFRHMGGVSILKQERKGGSQT
jgi:hypothetical protein